MDGMYALRLTSKRLQPRRHDSVLHGVRDQARLVGAEFTTRPQPKRHKWMTGRSSISAYYIYI